MNDRKSILTALLVLALVSLACGVIPTVTRIETGPTQTVDIRVPLPEGDPTGTALNLEFVAGELKLAPGAGDYLASGTATYNAPDFEPKLQSDGSTYTLRNGDMQLEGLPKIDDKLVNTWELALSDAPMSLSINAGAYTGDFELGGLALERLTISEGGSDLTVSFSTPNQAQMSTFNYTSGGATVDMTGLANANFSQMSFNGGAGDYTLSFDGELQRDATVLIDSGVGTLTLIVPPGANAVLTFEGGLSSVNAGDGWQQNGQTYSHPGVGLTITITVKMGAGTLNLKSE